MNKSDHTLSKRIAEKIGDNKSNRQSGLVFFLANQSEIEEALNEGWSVRLIWEQLREEKKFPLGYQILLKLINCHIRNKRTQQKTTKQEGNRNKDQAKIKSTEQGFNFDSTINQEEII